MSGLWHSSEVPCRGDTRFSCSRMSQKPVKRPCQTTCTSQNMLELTIFGTVLTLFGTVWPYVDPVWHCLALCTPFLDPVWTPICTPFLDPVWTPICTVPGTVPGTLYVQCLGRCLGPYMYRVIPWVGPCQYPAVYPPCITPGTPLPVPTRAAPAGYTL